MKKLMHRSFYLGCFMILLVSCKKDTSPSLEIAITSDDVYHPGAFVNVKEIWLNYATKKSKSEWLKLEIQPGIYDLADLYLDQRDTVILAQTTIEDAKTLLQLRFIFGNEGNSIITQNADTLDMSVSAVGLSGVKVGINKGIEAGRQYDLRLAVKGDSTSIYETEPIFDPVIRVDSLTVKP